MQHTHRKIYAHFIILKYAVKMQWDILSHGQENLDVIRISSARNSIDCVSAMVIPNLLTHKDFKDIVFIPHQQQ